MTGIGERIRSKRQQIGLAQADLAEVAGISQQHLSLIERGRVSPTARTQEKIAAALGLETVFLPVGGAALRDRLHAWKTFEAWERTQPRPTLEEGLARSGELAGLALSARQDSLEDLEAKALEWIAWRSRLPKG